MNFEYSAKNIPLADEKTYMEMMIHSVEKFERNISWRAWFKLNPDVVIKDKETYDFKSTRASPKLIELRPFKIALTKLIQGIKFRKRSNK